MNLQQNTQRPLNGDDVSCINFAVRKYTSADGVEREGLTAQLSIASVEGVVVVGEGSVFNAGGKRWRVLSLTEGDPWGSMGFEPVDDE